MLLDLHTATGGGMMRPRSFGHGAPAARVMPSIARVIHMLERRE
jgi:hypothetical protein